MRSILTVTVPATETALTTLARVKLELGITNTNSDAILEAKIDEASSDASAFLGFVVERETVAETFWPEAFDAAPAQIILNRTPVVSITSVVMDGVTLSASLYRLDKDKGLLYALDASGYACSWFFCKSLVITYVGGYLLPDASGRNLPHGIEGAVIDLVSSFWQSRGRDPLVKSEDIPGVMSREYWVGAVGDEGELPPGVVAKLAPFRRVPVA